MKIKLLKTGTEMKIKYYSYPHIISDIINNKIKYTDGGFDYISDFYNYLIKKV